MEEEDDHEDEQVSTVTSLTCLNLILTVIAVLLAIRIVHDLWPLGGREAHATTVMPVQIESVRGPIPVSIEEPISGYPGAVCVSPCK
jgi:hypothetical protein